MQSTNHFYDIFSDCTEKCYSVFCQLPFASDCVTYLTCEWTNIGFHGTKRVCSHGTFWAGELATNNVSCISPVDATCPNGMVY